MKKLYGIATDLVIEILRRKLLVAIRSLNKKVKPNHISVAKSIANCDRIKVVAKLVANCDRIKSKEVTGKTNLHSYLCSSEDSRVQK
ncbi:unnamed protein product [Sphenostylis stenocarpa]|uniref:Uncharacterized protein n=1 Tax=Sphenostylis stenocarpa TaxID=92480 RepID=A0AA86VDY0_9FABA|nr:unnamed protein product [Sphenostylis stenocarpa]